MNSISGIQFPPHMKRSGLWHEPDFLKLWAGQAVSQLGSSISLIGLPLVAVLALHASPFEMGLLSGCGGLSILLFGLFAGACADRFPRRAILIVADLARAVLLATIPVAALTHRLSMGQMYLVAAANAAFTVLFDVSYQAYLPSLVGRDKMLDANSKLSSTESAAEIVGPGLTGLLIQLMSAPVAILIDAVSFLGSAISVLMIRRPEAARRRIDRPARPVAAPPYREAGRSAIARRTAGGNGASAPLRLRHRISFNS